ncbi:MarR family transcriptional regulator [Iningainema tapete]|uniref:Uncharacterized protein n=1 Tax=Iningainema tapete BLCC-T55 TaxID=2748662 RepID=A0A8J6XKL9_9CYAN|nr:helix-turn-helix domain-containing protein [Iningainema tapete]MBD2778640.1 hypothetical protein [Iningainema tapete BLCC-T55]
MSNQRKKQTSKDVGFAVSSVTAEEAKSSSKLEIYYRLTHEELLTWIEKYDLKWSEVKLYLYFCTLNPFGDQDIEFSPSELYSQLKIKKSAFYSAVARLETLGLLDFQVSRAHVRASPFNRTTFHLNGKLSTTVENIPLERKDFQKNGNFSKKMDNNSTKMENRRPEPAQDKDSSVPHTLHTYSDFKRSLSDSERENFEKFVRAEYKRTEGKEIRHISAFLKDEHFQEWWEKYQNRPEAAQEKQRTKWENHPEVKNWIEEIERTSNPLAFAIGDEEKMEFIKWANENKIFSWHQEEEE